MPVENVTDESGVAHRSKRIAENTLSADHTYTSTYVGHRGMVTGHWRLSGRWLTYEFTTRKNGRRVVEQDRAEILKLSGRQLILSDGQGRDGEWTRVR